MASVLPINDFKRSLTNEQLSVSAAIAFKLASLGLSAKFVEPVSQGPIVTVYRFQPQGSTRVSQIESLAQDFAVTLGVEEVFVKRMPGETAIGIAVPNRERNWVQWRNIVGTINTRNWILSDTKGVEFQIPLLLGIDQVGECIIEDLTLMPHLLLAGSTGSGKSTLLNSIIASLIYGYSPTCIRFIMSDTKGVEFLHFTGAPHLLYNPCTSVYQTAERLTWLISEMELRLKKYPQYNARNILEYNSKSPSKLPYIVVIIDELADLLQDKRKQDEESRGPSIGKIIEAKLCHLAQKARASGIHIIASTQRPSVKLIEGNIKANFPARLTFRLPSEADSRTVLGTSGAEHLLSRGDMLFINPNKPGLQRIHAPIASIEDIKAAVEYSVRS